jgi:hypothetical protein
LERKNAQLKRRARKRGKKSAYSAGKSQNQVAKKASNISGTVSANMSALDSFDRRVHSKAAATMPATIPTDAANTGNLSIPRAV